MINYYIDKFKTSFVEPIEQNYFIPVVKKINKITVRNTFMIHYLLGISIALFHRIYYDGLNWSLLLPWYLVKSNYNINKYFECCLLGFFFIILHIHLILYYYFLNNKYLNFRVNFHIDYKPKRHNSFSEYYFTTMPKMYLELKYLCNHFVLKPLYKVLY